MMPEAQRRGHPASMRPLLAAGLVVLTGACGTNHNEEAGPMAADTARGVVVVVGAEPLSWVALQTPEGQLSLSGDAAESLRQAAGVEVWVSGARAENGALHVDAYRIRAVDGVTAVDGVLEVEGQTAVLVTAGGETVRYAPAPAGLRALEGRRVWISGPPGGEPLSWGALDP